MYYLTQSPADDALAFTFFCLSVLALAVIAYWVASYRAALLSFIPAAATIATTFYFNARGECVEASDCEFFAYLALSMVFLVPLFAVALLVGAFFGKRGFRQERGESSGRS